MKSAYRWAVGLMVPLLVACPRNERHSSESSEQQLPCLAAYAQCKMPDGPLGVCNEVPCSENQRPPCLRCISQH
jgi:hypothetical protein